MTTDKLIAELDKALQFPGVANAWTMPIKARIDMLSTGIRTPIGIKVFGKDLDEMEKLAKEIEAVVKAVPGTTSAFAERITGGFYLNIEPDREQLARYGLAVGELQDVIGTALGGEMVTTTVEGRERFGVTVRYPRELRSDPQQIAREVLVPTMDGAMIPLGQLAKVVVAKGAPGIRTENALLSAYIYVDIRDRDIGGYVADAQEGGRRTGQVPARLLRHLERPVRIHGTGHREDEDRHPGDPAVDLPAALPQLQAPDRNPDRHALGALRAGRRGLADVAARLQPVGGRGRRLHRAGRRGGGNRRGDADLPRSCLGGGQGQMPRGRAARPTSPTSTRR